MQRISLPFLNPGSASNGTLLTVVGGAVQAVAPSFAPLASPAFTGTPTAPTAAAGNNTTQVATTAFVTAAVSTKANLASPAFTGSPTAPTATAGSFNTMIATTAFVSTAVTNGVVKALQGFVSGLPLASEVIGGAIAPYAMTLVSANCRATSGVAANASTVFTIRKNGTSIGTITFTAGATLGSFSFTNTAIAVNDVITVVAPSTQDTKLADVSISIRGS